MLRTYMSTSASSWRKACQGLIFAMAKSYICVGTFKRLQWHFQTFALAILNISVGRAVFSGSVENCGDVCMSYMYVPLRGCAAHQPRRGARTIGYHAVVSQKGCFSVTNGNKRDTKCDTAAGSCCFVAFRNLHAFNKIGRSRSRPLE